MGKGAVARFCSNIRFDDSLPLFACLEWESHTQHTLLRCLVNARTKRIDVLLEKAKKLPQPKKELVAAVNKMRAEGMSLHDIDDARGKAWGSTGKLLYNHRRRQKGTYKPQKRHKKTTSKGPLK
jgi:hypothetical protein